MSELRKKRLIVLLLFLSCLLSATLLIATPEVENRRVRSLAQVDSLIRETFVPFNIGEQQIDSRYVTVDSTFRRRVFRVTLPPTISKTQLHARIQRTLHPYDISSPSRVMLPAGDMNIHLVWNQTVIRTLHLRTDPDSAPDVEENGLTRSGFPTPNSDR